MKVRRINLQEQKYGYDISLLFVTIFLCVFGLIMIYSASYYTAEVRGYGASYYLNRQIQWTGIGLVALIGLSFVPYRLYKSWMILAAYGASLILMILTSYTSLGHTAGGRTRWITLLGMTFQTAEIVKIGLILMLSWLVMRFARAYRGWRLWLMMLVTAIVPFFLVLSNDLSSAVIILSIPLVMIVILNRNRRLSIFMLVVFLILLAFLIYVKNMDAETLQKIGKNLAEKTPIHEYQMRRFYIWNDPTYSSGDTDGQQVLQGLYAIGSGGLFGKGLGASTQKLGFVPEASNDMIFAILCEELGLFGAFSLIILYIFLLYRMLRIATQAEDAFGALFTIGVMTQIAVQVFFHIAVVTNLLPNTGISLPFISYGGTSSLFLMAEIGIVISIGRGRRERQKS
ncbi:MAG: cell division protein FtsW [Lachnospiraceae bacterium]|nr:cell division protein FtsW [Lachnospiraceae bacterium]